MIRKLTQLLFILSFTLLFLSSPVLAANISGHVKFGDIPVCSMVLANGQYMFTCSGDGSFALDVPLDANGEITVYAFCSGLAPYKQIITPDQGTGMQINMLAGEAGTEMDVDYTIKAMNTTWALVEGTITYNSVPVCAMALANGQYQFTCSGDGSFRLLVPLDDMGGILFYGFCEGLPPHQTLFTTNEIDFNADYDNDGYTVAVGDCNDFNAAINPGATDTCGDGVDQDCSGADEVCVEAVTLTGLSINGPTSVDENSSATFTATATWSDGSTTTVTPSWSESSPYASITSNGELVTSEVNNNQNATISASYIFESITQTASYSISIIDKNSQSGSVIGTWRLTSSTGNGQQCDCPGEVEYETDAYKICGTEFYTFNADQTWSSSQTTDEYGDPYNWGMSGIWNVSGNAFTITITSEGPSINEMHTVSSYTRQMTINFNNSDQFTLFYTDTDGAFSDTFTRSSTSGSLVGTWKTTSVSVNGQATSCPGDVEYAPNSYYGCADTYATFNSDGTFTTISTGGGESLSTGGTWTSNGSSTTWTISKQGASVDNMYSISPVSATLGLSFNGSYQFTVSYSDYEGTFEETYTRQ